MTRELRVQYKFGNNEIVAISDSDGNKAQISFWKTRARAEAAILSLSSCKNCINCENCEECEDCIQCKGCKECRNCERCVDCFSCASCYDCAVSSHCLTCEKCLLCTNCIDGSKWVTEADKTEADKTEDLEKLTPSPTQEEPKPKPKKGRVTQNLYFVREDITEILTGWLGRDMISMDEIMPYIPLGIEAGSVCRYRESDDCWVNDEKELEVPTKYIEVLLTVPN